MLEENRDIASSLFGLAAALDFAGVSQYKAKAFRRVARAVISHPRPLRELRAKGLLGSIGGIGRSSREAIDMLLATGRLPRYDEARSAIPAGLAPLLEHPSLEARRLGELHRALGIGDRDSAIAALRSFAYRGSGITDGEARRLLKSIESAPAVRPGPIPLEEAIRVGEDIAELMKAALPGLIVLESGDLRRRSPGLNSLSFLAGAPDPAPVLEAFLRIERVASPILLEPDYGEVLLDDGWRARLRVVEPARIGSAHVLATGSAAHLTAVEERAEAAGMQVRAEGLFRDGRPVASATEEEVYRALGATWIPPELREGHGEMEAAEAGALPRLVDFADLCWDAGLVPGNAAALDQTLRALQRDGARAAGVVCVDLPGETPGAGARRRAFLEASRGRFPGFPALETGPETAGAVLLLPPWDRSKEELLRLARARGLRVAIGSGASHPAARDAIRGGVALARRAGIPPEGVLLAPPV